MIVGVATIVRGASLELGVSSVPPVGKKSPGQPAVHAQFTIGGADGVPAGGSRVAYELAALAAEPFAIWSAIELAAIVELIDHSQASWPGDAHVRVVERDMAVRNLSVEDAAHRLEIVYPTRSTNPRAVDRAALVARIARRLDEVAKRAEASHG